MQAALWDIPRNPQQWALWSFNHRASHDLIRQAILKKSGTQLADYPIEPVPPNDIKGWLQNNSQLHIDMNAALGQQSNDLLDVDLSDERQLIGWTAIHAQEHRDAEAAAGVSS